MSQISVVGISGSLRSGSFNTLLLQAAQELAPDNMTITPFTRLRDIPPYDDDVLRNGDPEPVAALRAQVVAADAILIASPEYNWGMPGVLKNAIDWVSRPMGQSPLPSKVIALMGASAGPLGTIRAQLQWRQVLPRTSLVDAPEVLVSDAHTRFDTSGKLTDPTSRELLSQLLVNMAASVEASRAATAQAVGAR